MGLNVMVYSKAKIQQQWVLRIKVCGGGGGDDTLPLRYSSQQKPSCLENLGVLLKYLKGMYLYTHYICYSINSPSTVFLNTHPGCYELI